MAHPVKLPGGQQIDIHSWTQGVISVWATLPKEVRAKDISAARVAARLKGHLDAIEWGVVVAEFPVMPDGCEMLAYRLELAGRDLDGRSTPKTMARWRTDLSGLVFDLHVHDTELKVQVPGSVPVPIPAHTSRAGSLVFNPTGLSTLAKRALWKQRLWHWLGHHLGILGDRLTKAATSGTATYKKIRRRLGVRLNRTSHWCFDRVLHPYAKHEQAKFDNPAVLAIPIHLRKGTQLTIRCRFPKGWKASRQWQIMFALVGLRRDPIK